jgi:dihydrofolate reductase
MSLDGYIAGPNGEHDWILMDPDIDFAAMSAAFDTYLIGRKTFEAMQGMGTTGASTSGTRNIICSRSMNPAEYPKLTISTDAVRTVAELKGQPGKDIALFGGGELFRSLLAAGLVDRVEVALIPVLLGGGIPLLATPAERATLKLRSHRVYATTGTVGLEYDIAAAAPAKRRRAGKPSA